MKSRTYKRRNYFIKKQFQADFMIRFCLILFSGIALSTILLLIFSQDSLTSVYASSGLEIKQTATAIMPQLVMGNLISLAAICLCAIAVLLFISHKIAGPLYRFETDLLRLADGDLTVKTHLRHKDQLKDLEKAMNTLSESIQTKIHNIDRQLENLQILNAQGKPVENHLSSLQAQIRKDFNLHNNS